MSEAKQKTAELEREVREHRFTEAARDHHAARERLYSAAVQSSNDAIVTKSLDGIITGWNPAAERLFGYRADEAIGKSINLIVPPDRSAEVEDICSRVGRGESIEQHETVLLRRDGSPAQVSLSISPIKTPSGQIIGASKIARDITESRKTEQALRQQIEERRRIFETSQDLILVTDTQGLWSRSARAARPSWDIVPEEMIGHSAIEFIHPDDLESSREEMRAARRGHAPDHVRYALHPQGRTDGDAVVDGHMVRTGRRHFFIGRDMTESRLAQETLRESEQLARNIIETALDAFIQMDDNGAILNWNSQAEQIFGWPREEVLGKNLIELIVVDGRRSQSRARPLSALRPGIRFCSAAAKYCCAGATEGNSGPS